MDFLLLKSGLFNLLFVIKNNALAWLATLSSVESSTLRLSFLLAWTGHNFCIGKSTKHTRYLLDRCLWSRLFSFSSNCLRASVIRLTQSEHSLTDGASRVIAFLPSLSFKVRLCSDEESPFIMCMLPFKSVSLNIFKSLRNTGCNVYLKN